MTCKIPQAIAGKEYTGIPEFLFIFKAGFSVEVFFAEESKPKDEQRASRPVYALAEIALCIGDDFSSP
ncbi:hypothetical protein [Desulfocicer vacuolatum]|uniref:hypothetical protein n=1 Tax=Desulfocicer vacuolatum TaxID=2298 RepID=UPI000A03FAC1|nr:hypothetical protein [Desulfocicer vacuolatum]